MEDLRPSLTGRRLYREALPDDWFWRHFPPPPAQNSVIIYNNGDVWEKAQFDTGQINDPAVHTYIPGGSDFRAEPDSFEYDALIAQGYGFRDNGAGGGYTPPED